MDDFVSFVFVFWSPTFSLVASGQEESGQTNGNYRKEPVIDKIIIGHTPRGAKSASN